MKVLPHWASPAHPFGCICREWCVYIVLTIWLALLVWGVYWVYVLANHVRSAKGIFEFSGALVLLLIVVIVMGIRLSVVPNAYDRGTTRHSGFESPWSEYQFFAIFTYLSIAVLYYGVVTPVMPLQPEDTGDEIEWPLVGLFITSNLVTGVLSLRIMGWPQHDGHLGPEHDSPEKSFHKLWSAATMGMVYDRISEHGGGVSKEGILDWLRSYDVSYLGATGEVHSYLDHHGRGCTRGLLCEMLVANGPPTGWERYFDEPSGRHFYVETITQKVSWGDPEQA